MSIMEWALVLFGGSWLFVMRNHALSSHERRMARVATMAHRNDHKERDVDHPPSKRASLLVR